MVHWIGEVDDGTGEQVPGGVPDARVQLYRDSEGGTIAEVARELGVGAETFRK